MRAIELRPRLLLVLIWILPAAASVLGLILVPPRFNPGMSMWEAFGAHLMAWMTWALWVPVILWVGDRVPFERTRWLPAIAVHLAGSLLVGAVQVYVTMYILRAFRIFDPDFGPSSLFAVGVRYYGGQMQVVYWAIVCAHVAIRWHEAFRKQAVVAAKLESDLVSAQLHALRAQLNPHFLFNALNSVVTLIGRDTAGAQRMLVRLSELLRVTLAAGDESEVSLHHELELAERYLEIERIRFGDRLEVHQAVSPPLLDAMVPALLLQPIVENAITHGVSRVSGRAIVEIGATLVNDRLELFVQDNGPGPNAAPRRPGAGIGIANVRQRLERLFGDEQRVVVATVPSGGCRVTLAIPYRVRSAETDGAPVSVRMPTMEHPRAEPARLPG